MGKVKIAVVGNCQARPLASIMQKMASNIEIINIAIVHLLTDKDEEQYTSSFEDADFIVTQFVQPSYPCNFVTTENLKKKYGSKVITIVNLFYRGDTPYLSNLPKDIRLGGAPFGDYEFPVVYEYWKKGKSQSEAVAELERLYANGDGSTADSSMEELLYRESFVDVKICDFLGSVAARRFHTFNHPTNRLLTEYTRRILQFLSIEVNSDPGEEREYLDQLVPFFTAGEHKLTEQGKVRLLTTEDLVDLFYQYYDLHCVDFSRPKKIVQYWDGKALPDDISELIKTWQLNNPEFEHELFDYKKALAFIEEHYGDDGRGIFLKAKLPAMQSDIFRIAYCLKMGGVYVDAATKCSTSISPLYDASEPLTVVKKWHGGIWNGFILATRNDHTLNKIWNSIVTNVKEELFDNVWAATGPGLFNQHCNTENVKVIEQSEVKKYFDLVNNLKHKGETHWSKMQEKESIFRKVEAVTINKETNGEASTAEDQLFSFIQSLPLEISEYILQDLPVWIERGKYAEKDAFQHFWRRRQEFRSVIRYRARIAQTKFNYHQNLVHEILKIVGNSAHLFVNNLYLSCDDIGAGLYIEHGFSTIIFAKKVGRNFWINQNVTVGTGKGGNPTIGDDVRLGANCVVIGGFKLNDRVKVGAGAVLNFEVPAGSTVVSQRPRVLLEE